MGLTLSIHMRTPRLGEAKQLAKLRPDDRCLRSEAWGSERHRFGSWFHPRTPLLAMVAKFYLSGPRFSHLKMGQY